MKWEKGSWPPSLPVSGFPGLPQELYKMYFRAVCLSGEAGAPISPSSTLGVHTPALLVSHGRAPRREDLGGSFCSSVPKRHSAGVWEARARTPGGAHVSVAGRAAPTLQLAWGQSWERLKRAQGLHRAGLTSSINCL